MPLSVMKPKEGPLNHQQQMPELAIDILKVFSVGFTASWKMNNCLSSTSKKEVFAHKMHQKIIEHGINL